MQAQAARAQAAQAERDKVKPAIQLRDWYIRRDECRKSGKILLLVEGVRCDPAAGSSMGKTWHSHVIVERVSDR